VSDIVQRFDAVAPIAFAPGLDGLANNGTAIGDPVDATAPGSGGAA
jgi:hypothetical protein